MDKFKNLTACDIFALIGVIAGVLMGCISLYEGNNTVSMWAFNCLTKTV